MIKFTYCILLLLLSSVIGCSNLENMLEPQIMDEIPTTYSTKYDEGEEIRELYLPFHSNKGA